MKCRTGTKRLVSIGIASVVTLTSGLLLTGCSNNNPEPPKNSGYYDGPMKQKPSGASKGAPMMRE